MLRRVTLRRAFNALIVLLLCISGGLFVFEMGTRWLFPEADPRGKIRLVVDENRCLGGAKNSATRQWNGPGEFDVAIDINRYGYRDDKDFRDAAPDAIFAVGDSFTMGMGVEERDRYTEIVESRLGRPIYNIGIVGDFDQYRSLVRCAEKAEARIRNLMIGVYVGNDIKVYGCNRRTATAPPPKKLAPGKPAVEREKPAVAREKPAVKPKIPAPEDRWTKRIIDAFGYRGIKNWLHFNSAGYNFIAQILPRNERLRRFLIKTGFMYDRRMCEVTVDSDVDRLVDSSAERLMRLAKDYNSLIVAIPSKRLREDGVSEARRRLEREIHVKFVGKMRELGLPLIDLLPVIEAKGGGKPYYYKVDGHFNAAGHRLAGEFIAQRMQELRTFGERASKP